VNHKKINRGIMNIKDSNQRKNQNKFALNTFFKITSQWNLTESEERHLLGNPSLELFADWKKSSSLFELEKEGLIRISHVVNIYTLLKQLFPNSDSANNWIKKPNTNTLFSGDSALVYITQGDIERLETVQQYISSICD